MTAFHLGNVNSQQHTDARDVEDDADAIIQSSRTAESVVDPSRDASFPIVCEPEMIDTNLPSLSQSIYNEKGIEFEINLQELQKLRAYILTELLGDLSIKLNRDISEAIDKRVDDLSNVIAANSTSIGEMSACLDDIDDVAYNLRIDTDKCSKEILDRSSVKPDQLQYY